MLDIRERHHIDGCIMIKEAKKSVFGIFRDRSEAEHAIELFLTRGFSAKTISALFPFGDDTHEFAHQKGSKAPEGAATGGAAGVVLGGTLGWLAGVGTLSVIGVGPLLAAGPILATLAGASVGGVVGALGGSLIGMGIPEYVAKRFEGKVKDGGILVSIHCEDTTQVENAEKILVEAGASDISSSAESASKTEEAAIHEAHN